MTYSPQNQEIFLAVFEGAMGGMAADRYLTSGSAASYSLMSQVAGAFAQEYDTLRGSTVATAFELQLTEQLAAGVWNGKFPTGQAASLLASSFAVQCAAILAAVSAGAAYMSGQSVDVGGRYTLYTPSFTNPTTDAAIGNGTITGNYLVQGTNLIVNVGLVVGGTTAFGTSPLYFPFPAGITPDFANWPVVSGFGFISTAGFKLSGGVNSAYPIGILTNGTIAFYTLGDPALVAGDEAAFQVSLPII